MTDPGSPAALEESLLAAIADLSPRSGDDDAREQARPEPVGVRPPTNVLREVFDAQVTSRHLDVVARELRAVGRGFYTISSAGHESNAAVAHALRPTDPALLHYRSGAFYVARAGQVSGSSPVRDIVQSLTGDAAEPIAGGRHKVFGNTALSIIPQTSTIASHLPRAVGLAIALHRAHRLGVDIAWPADAVVVCSFGDASANHSTAVGAVNTALNTAFRGLPVPVLFLCEDNGIGISVPTPAGWIETAYGSRPGLAYLVADGADTVATLEAAAAAVRHVRDERKPAFLHLRTVRYLGHAGSDAEIGYRGAAEVAADYGRDPILGAARALVAAGAATPAGLVARYRELRAEVDGVVADLDPASARPLDSAAEIEAPLSPRTPDEVARVATSLYNDASPDSRIDAGRGNDGDGTRRAEDGAWDVREDDIDRENDARLGTSRNGRHRQGSEPAPATLAESINAALASALEHDPRVVVFGEDVGRKGGVYGVTRGLAKRFGAARVFDTLLDEQAVLGLGLGAGLAGLIPVPEIQYLAYLHNAEDQLRGEAASLSFFSSGQYRNPLVVRIAGLAYQRGFGGHFHNDNAVAVLRDIPGLVVACPSRGDDAAAMLRTCLAAAAVDGTVSAFLEPIALYHTRDLYADGDGEWLAADHGEHVAIGRARLYDAAAAEDAATVHASLADAGTAERPTTGGGARAWRAAGRRRKYARRQVGADRPADLAIATFGNGVPMSLRAARRLAGRGITARVLDLRWLAPLPVDDLVREANLTGRVLVADETRHSGGVGEGVVTALVESGYTGPIARVSSRDSFVPLGTAARHVLLGEHHIEAAAVELAQKE